MAKKIILLFSWLAASLPLAAQPTERPIFLDVKKEKGGFNDMFRRCVGAGRANEGLRADWQAQLAYVRKECGFTYIRMHGLFTDDMGVYREDRNGKPMYNWQYIDALFDFIVGLGMKPFVELGFMPNALASGGQTIFWWRGNVTPPKDYGKWADLIFNFVSHCTERYGKEEVRTWYFEVWNEPDLKAFFSGTQADYFKLYTTTAEALKRVSTDYRVGGPASAWASASVRSWIPQLLDFCAKNKTPIDFCSTHAYGVRPGSQDEHGNAGTVLDPDPNSVVGPAREVRGLIASSPFPGLELHLTEWSSSYASNDPMHDSYHQAAYILEKIKRVGGGADSMSYWTFTDIFEEAGPRWEAFHGGFGLLNYQSIPKAAFYAYQFLNRLGGTELDNEDASSWACTDKKGGYQVLFWDFTMTHPGGVNNQDFYNHDLPPLGKVPVKLVIANLPPGRYGLELYKTGYEINDPYTMYLKMGAPPQLTKRQVEAITKANNGAPIEKTAVTVKAGAVFSKLIPVRENDCCLVILRKM